MNDWNHLEKRLSSWTPRKPSSKVRERLFANEEPQWNAGAGESLLGQMQAPWWREWAVAAAIVGAVLFTAGNWQEQISPLALARGTSFVASAAMQHNIWPRATFDWTNAGAVLSPSGSLFDTNDVIQ